MLGNFQHFPTIPILVVLCSVLVCACSKLEQFQNEINGINEEISDLDKRVSSLEELLNTNIASIQKIMENAKDIESRIAQIESNTMLTEIEPMYRDSTIVGYKFKCQTGESFILYTSEQTSPIIIPERAEDGYFYWKVNGEWLYYDGENKVPLGWSITVHPATETTGWSIEYSKTRNVQPIYRYEIPIVQSMSMVKDVKASGPYAYITLYNGSTVKLRIEQTYFDPLKLKSDILAGTLYGHYFDLDAKKGLGYPMGEYTARGYTIGNESLVECRAYVHNVDPFEPNRYLTVEFLTTLAQQLKYLESYSTSAVVELYYQEEGSTQWELIQREIIPITVHQVEFESKYLAVDKNGNFANERNYITISGKLPITVEIPKECDWISVVDESYVQDPGQGLIHNIYFKVEPYNGTHPRIETIKLKSEDWVVHQAESPEKEYAHLGVCKILQTGAYEDIAFEDDYAWLQCMEMFDRDDDGRVTYAEALRAPRTISHDYSDKIKSFKELKYFFYLYSGTSSNLCNWTALEEVEFFDDIPSKINRNFFKGCKSLRKITLPNRCYEIGESAFEDSGLEEIELSEYCKIGKAAFKNCKNLQYVYKYKNDKIQHSIEHFQQNELVPESAFEGCSSLKKYDLYWTECGRRAFYNTDLSEQTIYISKKIGFQAFANTHVKTLEFLTQGATGDIGPGAFTGCKDIQKVIMRYGVPKVDKAAFDNKIPLLQYSEELYDDIKYSGWLDFFDKIEILSR